MVRYEALESKISCGRCKKTSMPGEALQTLADFLETGESIDDFLEVYGYTSRGQVLHDRRSDPRPGSASQFREVRRPTL